MNMTVLRVFQNDGILQGDQMLLLDSDQFLANGLSFLNLWETDHDQIAHRLEVAINQNLGTDDT
jgi:hypothetical protein